MKYTYAMKGWNGEAEHVIYQRDVIWFNVEAENETEAMEKAKRVVSRDHYMVIDVKLKEMGV